jgi:hypothetical protein
MSHKGRTDFKIYSPREKVTALQINPIPPKRKDTSRKSFEITNSKHVDILKNYVLFPQPPSRMHAAAAAAAAATKQNSHDTSQKKL